MVAKTFQGLEDVLRDELISLGAENVELGLRMVSFEGDLEMMYKANLCCHTALRILKPIAKFTACDTDELYDIIREFEWEKYMTPDSTFAIEATVNSASFTNSRYVTYRVKDAIDDQKRNCCEQGTAHDMERAKRDNPLGTVFTLYITVPMPTI